MEDNIIMTNEEILALAKEWLKSKSNKEWVRAFKKLEKEIGEEND